MRSFALATTLFVVSSAAQAAMPSRELVDLTLEELANIQVTSVAKRSQSLADAPASVFVIRGEQIRRSGATTLPEALRLAPNLQVARANARNYAISARGFNNVFSNKLLVLIDGRTIYSPLFSGVFWDAQDVLIDDIDRIEVISGPAATLWGANAVNGVINIITRSTLETQGELASVTGGRDFRDLSLRHGGKTAGGAHYRVYGKFAGHDDTLSPRGLDQNDGWRRTQAGFRSDWSDRRTQFTLQGDAYTGRLRQVNTANIAIGGANLLARMTRTLADASEVQVQAYLDHTERDQPLAFVERLETFDLEAQHSTTLGGKHHVVWGGGYRYAMDRLDNGPGFSFLPADKNLRWVNLFVEDTVDLSDKLRLTVGHRMEHNSYTGLEQMPNVRLAFKPDPTQLWWTSLSRAVRTPSRIDRDFFTPALPQPVTYIGGASFQAEVARVIDIGYRVQPSAAISLSATAFYSRYNRLRTVQATPVGIAFLNNANGNSRGLELNGSWQVARDWRVVGGLVVQRIETNPLSGVADVASASNLASNDPSSYWQLRSSWDLSHASRLDMTLRHAGKLSRLNVPAYTALDVRYAWQIRPDLEVAIIGQNLLDPDHAEFVSSEFSRGLLMKVTWRQ